MTATKPVINPAHIAEIVGLVTMHSEGEVDEIISAAHRVYGDWSRTSPESRANCLINSSQALLKELPRLTSLFVRENGKPMREASRDLERSFELMEVVAKNLTQWWKPEVVDEAQPVWARRRARGVTAVISPWNSPVLLSFKRFIPALATGNTVVVKPATHCPLTLLECIEIMTPHFPNGVLNAVTGDGSSVGEQLATDPRIRAVAFTGSTETGRRIMELASRTLKKVFLELGGNDPALVLHDAVLDPAAIGRMANAVLRAAGQVCVAVKRIYVHESRYDELVEKLAAAFDSVVVGDGLKPETTMGPLQNKSQFDFVNSLLDRCTAKHCTVLTKGRRLDPDNWTSGFFLLPSIILDAGPDDEIVSCEQFGPLVPILKFRDEDEAIARANKTEFGLRASVWSSDRDRAAAMADRLDAGAVFYNSHGIFRNLNLEFPGIKQSGMSRESRVAGLDHYADTYGFAD